MSSKDKTAYEIAYRLAQEQLSGMDLSDVAFNTSSRIENETLLVDFFGEAYKIENQGKLITRSGEETKIGEKILILHYLITADGGPLSRDEITFENVPGGQFYYPTYKARTIDYLVRVFSKGLKDDGFIKATEQLGGRVVEHAGGMVKAKFLAFAHVPIVLIMWVGDKETGSSFQILYDSSITHCLSLEDIVVVTEQLVHRLARIAKSQLPAGPLYG